MKKRLLSMLTAFAVLLAMFPVGAYAAEDDPHPDEEEPAISQTLGDENNDPDNEEVPEEDEDLEEEPDEKNDEEDDEPEIIIETDGFFDTEATEFPDDDFGISFFVLSQWNDAFTKSADGVYEAYRAQLEPEAQAMYDEMKTKFATPIASIDLSIEPTFTNLSFEKKDNEWSFTDESKAEVQTWFRDNVTAAYLALEKDHPEMPWLKGSGFGPSYNYSIPGTSAGATTVTGDSKVSNVKFSFNTVDETIWNTNSFSMAVETAVNKVNAKKMDLTDVDESIKTIRAIHDSLCELITYDGTTESPFNQSAYSGLVSPNKTVCAGYATSFKLLCDKFDIPCVYVSGTAGGTEGGTQKGGAHAWNYVKIDDAWYAVDVTWADQTTINTDFFLVGSTTKAGSGWGEGVANVAFSASHIESGSWISGDNTLSFPYPTLSTDEYVSKIQLIVNQAPTAADVTYGATLNESTLTGGSVSAEGASEIQGAWSWLNPEQNVGTVVIPAKTFTALFTPEDPKYASVTYEVPVTVTPKKLTVTGATATRPYDGTNNVTPTGGTLDGLLEGDEVTFTLPEGNTTSPDAGTYTVTVTPTLTGKDAGNYTVSDATVTVTITKADPAVGTVSVEGDVYTTTPLSSITLKGDGADADNGTFKLDDNQTLTEGTKDYTWTFTPNNTTNYNNATGTVSITVKARELTGIAVTGTLTKATYQYGELFEPAGLTITATYADNGTEVIPVTDSNVSYTVEDGNGENKNLGNASDTPKTVTVTYMGKTATISGIRVNKAQIDISSIAWDGKEFTYDGTEKTVAIAANSLPENVEATYESNTATYVGNYSAVATLKYDNTNYELVNNGNLTVDDTVKYAWEIKAAEQDPLVQTLTGLKIGGNTLDLSTLVTGLVPNSEVSFAIDSNSASDTALDGKVLTSGSATGEVTIRVTVAALDVNGDGKPEYNAYTSDEITVTVTDKELQNITFTPSAVEKTYGDAVFAMVPEGAVGTLTYASTDTNVAKVDAEGNVTIVGVGKTTITADAAATDDYIAGRASYVLTVAKSTVTITADDKTAYTGASVPALTYTVTGLASGDSLTTAPTLAYETDPNMNVVGTTAILVSGAAVSKPANYNDIVYVNGTLTVTNRPSSSGGSSSGGGTAIVPNTGSDTETKSDGSTVTTTTGKDGTVTETTKRTDGSETVVVTRPDGTVTTTDREADGTVTKTVENPDGSSETTLTQPDGTEATTTVDRDGTTESSVNISSGTIRDSGSDPVALPIPAVRPGSTAAKAPTVSVTLPSGTTVAVEVPVRGVTAGTVAVVVSPSGAETVIKASIPTDDGLAFKVSGELTVKIVDNSKSFIDVLASDWHKNAVDFASARGLFNGTSASAFTPDGVMTRGMIATVLHNLENNPAAGVNNAFADVGANDWYYGAIQWATGKGLISGYGNGKIGPEDPITREQLAVILWNYAGSPSVSGELGFSDASTVSSYAKDAMLWATQNGIISGANGRLSPTADASRAQVAQMLMTYMGVTSLK